MVHAKRATIGACPCEVLRRGRPRSRLIPWGHLNGYSEHVGTKKGPVRSDVVELMSNNDGYMDLRMVNSQRASG
jgi:hypothetical protein